ncbi:hypothetical protein M514_27846 [Trichuris suis]|uniref:Uncharacterized protein n=1 Tax=Trichuris suis TaxID=68888 RepID=A0A085MRX8_9BILA|nr:hypothetical protein M513_14318 [Trichuris suis]KFD44953.1 hypothetical protein M513_14170 [Trichuris suis]KFD59974.1 hypothetical protein M514_27846 [Trichuris suis]
MAPSCLGHAFSLSCRVLNYNHCSQAIVTAGQQFLEQHVIAQQWSAAAEELTDIHHHLLSLYLLLPL